MTETKTQFPIAIVGMAGRFPDAPTLEAFWRNLAEGRESLVEFTDDQMRAAGVPAARLRDPNYVKRGTVLEGSDLFDAAFFGYSPREAEALDPQQRIFLECAWHALEDAGYLGENGPTRIGVFASVSINQYLFSNVLANRAFMDTVGQYQLMLASDKDFVATRIAYKLNLHGPSITVQTACSSSLVAVHMAVQSLLNGECDVALAGGSTVVIPQHAGYQFSEGMILSRDGRCCPFDAAASGTRAGSGAGVVVLRRATDAVRDRDSIRALILGTAINNDGARKVGYTAPSVDGQAEAIAAAQAAGSVEPSSIGYIEAHGTGTTLGDPIEIAALDRVFGYAAPRQSVAIGSLKSNLGHLDAAAGVGGLMKTILALEHRQIPPSLNYSTPNPQIDFTATPFFVNDQLRDWMSAGPRRAGISSFGIGGTNAHVVVEEAPGRLISATHRAHHVLTVSARSAAALSQAARDLADALETPGETALEDVAFTLHAGRRRFPFRLSVVAPSAAEAASALRERAAKTAFEGSEIDRAEVAFLFSGQGTQYEGMAAGLLEHEPDFAEPFEECRAILLRELGLDVSELIGAERKNNRSESRLTQTAFAQPVLFAIEYALACMWMRWGIVPAAMIGHSLGEYVAACIAGVFSLEDSLRLVVARANLMQGMAPGAMLSIPLAAEVVAGLGATVDIAAENTPQACTVSGTEAAIDEIERLLRGRGIDCRRLATSHAFHSHMMEGMLAPFREVLASIKLSAPRIPIVSNLTGTWMRPDQATNAEYWVRHVRSTVKFSVGLSTLTSDTPRALLEIGPGEVLCGLARQTVKQSTLNIVASLPHRLDPRSDGAFVQQALGSLWEAGVEIAWDRVHEHETVGRVPLPGYPFEQRSYWISPQTDVTQPAATGERSGEVTDWLYAPSWMRTPAPRARVAPENNPRTWLVFTADSALDDAVLALLSARGDRVLTVARGDAFAATGDSFVIDPRNRSHHDAVIAAAVSGGARELDVLHLWNSIDVDASVIEATAFYSPMYLAQALGEAGGRVAATVLFVSSQMHMVLGSDNVQPMKALLIGPTRVVPQELPHIRTLSIDIPAGDIQLTAIASWLLAERDDARPGRVVAYRDGQRWEQTWARLGSAADTTTLIRERGVYLITGGLGGVGLEVARDLAARSQARLVLTTRRPFPACETWTQLADVADSEHSASISALLELERLGAEVVVVTADAADQASMQCVITDTRNRFGTLNGIIHAAGIADGGMVLLKTAESAARVLEPKVAGTMGLAAVIDEGTLDFVVLFSSINAITGAVGSIAYTGANAFMDAFAASRSQGPTRVLSINWDTWGDVGMAVKTTVPADMVAERRHRLANGIRTHEGLDALRRALASDLPQVAVITKDLLAGVSLAARTERAAYDRARTERDAPVGEGVAPPTTVTESGGGLTTTEAIVGAIWRELLGVHDLGPDDDFFSLGGHSLLATSVLARVKQARGITLTLRTVFEAPTLRQFAALVDEKTGVTAEATSAAPIDDEEREEVEF
jgi:acyl transferase domain-containing protein